MRESQHEEVDPNEDFDETAHCVEENSHLENWLGIILVFHSFGNRVGEERDDSLTDSHKEQNLEGELEFGSNVCRIIQFASFGSVLVQGLIVTIIRIAIDWIVVETHGEIAVDNSEED